MKEGWQRLRIEDICEKASSNVAQKELDGVDGDFPIYGASGFIKNVNFYHRENPYIGIVKDGSGVGRVNAYPAKSSLLGTMQYILPRQGYNIGYIAYALKSLNLSSFATGAAIPHIYFKDYGKCSIMVPPLNEQERIVAELDLLTDVIDKQKKQLMELELLAQSIFYDMFGNPEQNMKGWSTCHFQDVCKALFAGGDVPKGEFSMERTEEYNVPILSNGVGEKALYGYTNRARVNEESITISGRGTIGYCEVRREPFFPVVRLIVAIPNEKIMLPVVMKYIIDALHLKGNGVAIPQLTIPMIKDLNIITPPLSIQQTFREKITAIERQKETINRSIVESQKLLNYTMDKYFG